MAATNDADDAGDEVVFLGVTHDMPALPQHLVEALTVHNADTLHIFDANIVSSEMLQCSQQAAASPLSLAYFAQEWHRPDALASGAPAADKAVSRAVLDLREGRWISVCGPAFQGLHTLTMWSCTSL